MPRALQGTFHSYIPIRRLGQGAFGEVTLASVLETGEVVALKRIHIRNTSALPDNVIREIKALQSVVHPNVVALQDVFPKGQALYLVQEYCLTDLANLLRKSWARLREPIVKGLMMQLLRGLNALHAAGIMHRDLKPSNTLVSHAGTIRLADFGLARPHDGGERPSYTHTVATRWYRAPELLYGARVYDTAVDLWAAGIIFADMLGLSPLVAGENDIDQLGRMVHTLGSIEPHWPGVQSLPDWGKISFPNSEGTPLAELLPSAPPAAIKLLAKFLRYDPSQRISAAAALQDDYFSSFPPPAQDFELAAWVRATLEPPARDRARAMPLLAPPPPPPPPAAAMPGAAPALATTEVASRR